MGVSELLGVDASLAELVRLGGATGVGAYALLWLIRRGDRLQRDNIDELKRQRDEWRKRAESAEEDLVAMRDEMARTRSDYQRQLRDCRDRDEGSGR